MLNTSAGIIIYDLEADIYKLIHEEREMPSQKIVVGKIVSEAASDRSCIVSFIENDTKNHVCVSTEPFTLFTPFSMSSYRVNETLWLNFTHRKDIEHIDILDKFIYSQLLSKARRLLNGETPTDRSSYLDWINNLLERSSTYNPYVALKLILNSSDDITDEDIIKMLIERI